MNVVSAAPQPHPRRSETITIERFELWDAQF